MQSREFQLETTLEIREAKADDAINLHMYCFANEKIEDIEKELKSDLEKMAEGRLYRLVVDASGYAVANIRMECSPIDPEVGKISRLAVSVPFRTFKLADQLIDDVYDIAAEKGMKTVEVDIPQSEMHIIEAYKKWGFVEKPVVTLQREIKSKDEPPQEAVDTSKEEKEGEPAQLNLGVNDEK